MLESTKVLDLLDEYFPNAHCELNYTDLYTLTIAVLLSAQTTDKKVNLITPYLFNEYPTLLDLSNAKFDKVYEIIKPLGLAKNKTQSIINLSNKVINDFNGVIPSLMEELVKLPGIGRKCANVILSEWFKIPSMPVDTHVERVTKRIGLVPFDLSTIQTEYRLREIIPLDRLSKAHHLFIFLGRYICKSRTPLCDKCPLRNECLYNKERKYRK